MENNYFSVKELYNGYRFWRDLEIKNLEKSQENITMNNDKSSLFNFKFFIYLLAVFIVFSLFFGIAIPNKNKLEVIGENDILRIDTAKTPNKIFVVITTKDKREFTTTFDTVEKYNADYSPKNVLVIIKHSTLGIKLDERIEVNS